MLFNSLDFFLCLPIVLGLYFALPHAGKRYLLIAASLGFYMYWSVPYVGLLLLSALVDYSVARRMDGEESVPLRRVLLFASLAVNLGLLGFFKYYNFFLDSLEEVGARPGFLPYAQVLLPLGISFYTFQTMSYTIDVYRGQLRAERSFPKLLLYVSFFPQLVAGPIVRAKDLLPQFDVRQRFDWENLAVGGRRVLDGMIKKVVIADNLAPIVAQAYAAPGEHSGPALLLATYLFALQIFCDFSGYSDIAIGLARMMGFRFMENFNAPYLARSIQDFWRRWHISLSTWLRDYLYISLGGNRGGAWRTYRNLLLTMLLGGLWHGASWNFVIWGALHGTWLLAERAWTARFPRGEQADGFVRATVSTLAVFHGVCVTWVFFRAETFADATAVLSRIGVVADGAALPLYDTARAIAIAALAGLYFYGVSRARRAFEAVEGAAAPALRSWMPRVPSWAPAMLGLHLVVLFGAASHEFLYFVF